MPIHFVESSSAVKLYVAEIGSDWLNQLGHDMRTPFIIVDLTPIVVAKALVVAQQHGLRGYDCVQLASALVVQQERLQRGLSPLTLISSDTELNTAARAESLGIEDPNRHP